MFRPLATSALALTLGAGAALADVTPAEVWASLEQTYREMGYRLDVGTRDDSGDTLRLENVVLGASPDSPAEFSMTFPAIEMNQVGDGTVRSVVEGDIAVVSRATDDTGAQAGFDAVLQVPGGQAISSGTVGNIRHSYVIPELRLAGTAVNPEGQAPLTLTLTDVRGEQAVRQIEGGGNTQSYDVRAAQMGLAVSGEGPTLDEDGMPDLSAEAGTESMSANVSISDLELVGTATTPGGAIDFEARPAEALREGLSMDGRLTMGALDAVLDTSRTVDGQQTSGSGNISLDSGEIGFALSEAGITFEGLARDAQVEASGDDMPLPLSYGVETSAGSLTMPLLQNDAPQTFALTYALEGVRLADELWTALDPQGQLPRDPASLNVDLSGDLVIAEDLINPEGLEQNEDMPIEPRRLSVNRLSLDGLGATAEVTGELTFGEDPTQPVGTLTGDFSGMNQLLDSLVAMGVLPQEQVIGARMMLAMFARPVEGQADRLQTQLEFREGGSIFANGQQVQ